MTFRVRPVEVWAALAGLVLFGTFMATSAVGGSWVVALTMSLMVVVSSASLLLRNQVRIELDDRSIEGCRFGAASVCRTPASSTSAIGGLSR
jgi:hypothetical protein